MLFLFSILSLFLLVVQFYLYFVITIQDIFYSYTTKISSTGTNISFNHLIISK